MTRNSITFLAATALTLGMATFVSAQESSGSDCPEDMNTEPGCQLEGAAETERQPVSGAATAPVEATDQSGEGSKTMTGADTGGEGGPPEDGTGSGQESGGAPATADPAPTDPAGTATEQQGVEGAETAPTPEGGENGQGSVTISDPEDAAPAEGDGAASAESSDGAGGSEGDQSSAAPAGHGDFAVAREENGRYYTAEDTPTFNIAADGTVDWLTYSGFRRYHSECHVCHGPDGMGSSYAPALIESVQNMDYYEFYGVVVNGKQDVSNSQNQVMPAFGTNQNVMCYLDDIYVYLLARGVGDLPRGRPAQKAEKTDMIQEAEDACMGA